MAKIDWKKIEFKNYNMKADQCCFRFTIVVFGVNEMLILRIEIFINKGAPKYTYES